MPALFGDAASPELLEAAHARSARVVIVAIYDPHSSRLVVERVRQLAPRVPLVVRTHSGGQASRVQASGPDIQAVHAEIELAIQMTRFAMRRFGVSANEVELIASGLRRRPAGSGGPPRSGPPGFRSFPPLLAWIGDRRRAGRERRPAPAGRATERLPSVAERSGSAPAEGA